MKTSYRLLKLPNQTPQQLQQLPQNLDSIITNKNGTMVRDLKEDPPLSHPLKERLPLSLVRGREASLCNAHILAATA